MNDQIFFVFYNLAHKSVFFDWLVVFFAHFLPYLVIFLAIVFLLFHNDILFKEKPFKSLIQKFREIFFVSFSVFLAWFFAILLKIIFQIPRPFTEFQNIAPLLQPTDYSFPSGHSAFFMATAMAIFLYHKKVGYLFIVFGLVIGLARIVAGVHYPLDILGGYLFGGLISYILVNLSKKINYD